MMISMKNSRKDHSWCNRFIKGFMNMELTNKVVVIYLIAVLVPTSVLAFGFYQINQRGLERTYYENQSNLILSAKENLTIQLNQISSAYNFYQQSDTLKQLLDGTYEDISNTLFYYIRDINPLLKATKVNPYITKIRIYGYQTYAMNMKNGLASISYFGKEEEFIQKIKNSGGIWELSQDDGRPELYYYRSIQTNTYPYSNGIVAFTVDLRALAESFYNQIGRPFYFKLSDGSLIEYAEGELQYVREMPSLLRDKKNHVYSIAFSEGFPSMLIPILPMKNIRAQNGFLFFTLSIMVIVFTAFYFLLNSSITSRLKAFTNHIRKSDAEMLMPFREQGYLDEVGVAISSYNDLLERTNNLIHENLKVQIQKGESDYYALQAQIKPHFLYNILENIRMNAEASHDLVTADMLLALGKHMRYNLNMSSQPIQLEDELYFARNYLQIHKIRMKEKISFEVLIAAEIDEVTCPRFLLQPLLENALQHGYRLDKQLVIQVLVTEGEMRAGMEEDKEKGKENIEAQREFTGQKEYVKITVQDNGNGIPAPILKQMQIKLRQKDVEESHHVGLLNVNSRLSSFCKSEKGCIFISSQEGKGTKIEIFLKQETPLGNGEKAAVTKAENVKRRNEYEDINC